jgi:hypothetical protein
MMVAGWEHGDWEWDVAEIVLERTGGEMGWRGVTTDGPFAETKEVIAGYPRPAAPAGRAQRVRRPA